MHNTRLFLPAVPTSWQPEFPAPDWQRWLMGDSRWHLPQQHPALLDSQHWLLAHPVQLRADIDCLRMTGVQVEPLPDAQLALLHKLLAEEVQQMAECIEMHPSVLAIRLQAADATCFPPLASVAGENLQQALPQGENAAYWIRCINSLQMACHQHALHEQGIHGLWFARPQPIPHNLPKPARILGGGPTKRWAQALRVDHQAEVNPLGKNQWCWLDSLPAWPQSPGIVSRWMGNSVHVHASLNHYWPHRLKRP